MTELSDNKRLIEKDYDLIEALGVFIKHHRLLQNKSQSLLAEEAGIVRSTLSLFERGENTSVIVFIQLLRALNLLHLLQEFQVKEQISSNQSTKFDKLMRSRSRVYRKVKIKPEPKSDWCFY